MDDDIEGALRLQADTRLCTIKLADGSERVIRSGVKGFLAEVNNTLRLEDKITVDSSRYQ